MDKLREKDIAKLAIITGLSICDLTKLSAMSLFDKATSINLLLLHDWKQLRKTRQYTVGQMTQALMDEYHLSRTRVQAAIYQKRKNEHYCSVCGRRSTKRELSRNNGLCDHCVVQSIRI